MTHLKTTALLVITFGAIGMIYLTGHLNRGEVDIAMKDHKSIISTSEAEIQSLIDEKNLSTIYLAGGCFWGVEEYMTRIDGVYDATSGYANGNTENPSYQDVIHNNTGHAETVRVIYDANEVTLEFLLQKYFEVIDPTSINKQGNDVGSQYRTGIYFENDADKLIIDTALNALQADYDKDIVVEAVALDNFYRAEEYHQDYLQKNPNGYCHIDLSLATANTIDTNIYVKPSDDEIKDMLSDLEYKVTQKEGTEYAFSSDLNNNYKKGIYVDIVTGEPLFLSTDKYDSGTGWPSFTSPIFEDVLIEDTANASLYRGTEVKSKVGESHLGHVFTDGPADDGGLRYCINGAALDFVSYDDMEAAGYAHLMHLLDEQE